MHGLEFYKHVCIYIYIPVIPGSVLCVARAVAVAEGRKKAVFIL